MALDALYSVSMHDLSISINLIHYYMNLLTICSFYPLFINDGCVVYAKCS